MTRALLTLAEAAAYLDLTPREVMARVKRHELTVVRDQPRTVTCTRVRRGQQQTFTYVRTLVKFRPADLDAWIAARIQLATRAPKVHPTSATPEPWARPARDRRFM